MGVKLAQGDNDKASLATHGKLVRLYNFGNFSGGFYQHKPKEMLAHISGLIEDLQECRDALEKHIQDFGL